MFQNNGIRYPNCYYRPITIYSNSLHTLQTLNVQNINKFKYFVLFYDILRSRFMIMIY